MSPESFRVVWTEPSTAPVDDSVIERQIGEHLVRVYVHPNERANPGFGNKIVSNYSHEWYLFIDGETPEWPVTYGYKRGDAAARLQVEQVLRWYAKDPSRLTTHKVPPGALPPPEMPKEGEA
jgi:hypothetical protein